MVLILQIPGKPPLIIKIAQAFSLSQDLDLYSAFCQL